VRESVEGWGIWREGGLAGWLDEWMDRRNVKRMDGQVDGWMDEWVEGRRVNCMAEWCDG
jgi:hypothetical protein